jgi:hypothetical protein
MFTIPVSNFAVIISGGDFRFEFASSFPQQQCHEEGPLNWKEIWTKTIDELPCSLAEELYKELLVLVQSVLTSNLTPGQIVGYLKMLKHNKNFKKWELSTSVLQKVPTTHPK